MSDVIVLKIPVRLLHDLLHKAEVTASDQPEQTSSNGSVHSIEPERTWTDKQRHLLFRLVYRLGHEGANARRFINAQLGITGDQEPSIKQASRLIDHLMDSGAQHGAA